MTGLYRQQYSLIFQIILLGCLAVFGFGESAKAQDVVGLQQGDYYEQSTANASYLINKKADLSLEQVLRSNGQFQPVQTPWLDFGIVDGRVWIKFPVKNLTDQNGEWIIDLQRQQIENLQVYLIREDGNVATLIDLPTGNVYSDRPIDDRYLAARFTLVANEKADMYVSYISESTSWMPVAFASPESYRAARDREERINWTLNGALIAMFLIALVMARVIGWKLSAAFCTYIGFGMLFVASQEGYLFQYFFRDDPSLFYVYTPFLTVGMAMSAILFARTLFETKTTFPEYDLVLKSYFYSGLAFSLVMLSLFSAREFVALVFLWMPVGAALRIGLGIKAKKRRLAGAGLFLLGSVFVLLTMIFTALAHLFPGYLSLAATLDFGHFALLAESIAFASAVVIRMLQMRNKLDDTLRSELATTREKLRLAGALRDSQSKFNAARRQAEQRRAELASASHDLQQPLLSLRKGLAELAVSDPEINARMQSAFDYLERLAGRNIENTMPAKRSTDLRNSQVECFQADAVLDNIVAMFGDEAKAKNLSLRYKPTDLEISADPLALMRIISNLVSNAIKHTQTGGILIACRPRADHLLLQVHDTGPGMDKETLKRLLKPYQKGERSSGTGLGLHLVESMCREQGLPFTARSVPEHGCTFSVQIPRC